MAECNRGSVCFTIKFFNTTVFPPITTGKISLLFFKWSIQNSLLLCNVMVMRFLKVATAGLIILFILLTLIGLLMPSSVTVMRTVDILAPVDSVRTYTNDPANWRYWINGADTAHFEQLAASSNNKKGSIVLGAYTVTVLENDPKYIVTSWKGESNREQLNRLQLYHSNTGTTVNWSFEQQLNWYPWERLSAMLHDKVFGPSMEASLAKLKKVCEKN